MMNDNPPLDPCLCPPNGMRQPPPQSHPSQGGNPYSDDLCRHVLHMHFNNYDLRDVLNLVALGAAKKSPAIPYVSIGLRFSMLPGTSVQSVLLTIIMPRGRCKVPTLNSWLYIGPCSQRLLLPSEGHICLILTQQKSLSPILKFIVRSIFQG
jgi:hypothetical protein